MKGLFDILNQPHKFNPTELVPLPYSWDLNKYMDFYGISESELTDTYIEQFMLSGWLDNLSKFRAPHCEEALCPHSILNEMLKSPEIKFVTKAIQDEFGPKYRTHIIKNVDNEGDRAWVTIIKDVYINDANKLSTILDKYMWVCTETRKFDNKYVIMLLEKILAENITDYVLDNCSNHIYHIAHKQDAKSIDKSGIRPRGEYESSNSRRAGRFYPNRVYCVVAPDSDAAKMAITKIKDDKHYSWDEFVIYKIDISKYGRNLQFYRDPQTHPIGCAAYTYAMFPPKMIGRVNFADI